MSGDPLGTTNLKPCQPPGVAHQPVGKSTGRHRGISHLGAPDRSTDLIAPQAADEGQIACQPPQPPGLTLGGIGGHDQHGCRFATQPVATWS